MADDDIEQLADAAAPAGETEPDLAVIRAQVIATGGAYGLGADHGLIRMSKEEILAVLDLAERQQQEIQRLTAEKDALAARIAAGLNEHRRELAIEGGFCRCGMSYPCPTVRALRGDSGEAK